MRSNATQHALSINKVVGVETEKVSKEKAVADVEEEKVSQIEVEVTKKKNDCEADLAKAEPALIAAQAALDTLNKVVFVCLFSCCKPVVLSCYFNKLLQQHDCSPCDNK